MQQLEPSSVLQLTNAVHSASKLSFLFQTFNDNLPYSILDDVKLIQYHSKLQVIMVQQNLLTFSILPSARDSEGRPLPGRLEHLLALHETVHTSEQSLIALVLHLHRLQAPFKQFLLRFYRL
jgi:hypothetical protein